MSNIRRAHNIEQLEARVVSAARRAVLAHAPNRGFDSIGALFGAYLASTLTPKEGWRVVDVVSVADKPRLELCNGKTRMFLTLDAQLSTEVTDLDGVLIG